MAYLNKVFLIGNLTRDPETRTTPKGTAVCQFGIAVSRQYKDEAGATREETTFVDIEAWGKQGELVAKYLTKGSLAMVEGRLRFDQWDDKTTGQKRSKLKVVLDNVQFLNSRGGGGGGASAAGAASSAPAPDGDSERPAAAPAARPAAKETVDDDVPF